MSAARGTDPLALALAPDVAAATRGDREAFTRLVDATRGVVCAIAVAILRDVDASKDVAQDVYLAAWTTMSRLHEPSSFLPWLRQITRNRAHHVLRTERRRRVLDNADTLLAAVADPRPHADDELISLETWQLVARALDELPSAAREVIILYYREGQSVRHVAELLGLSEDAVKQRLSRGRARLRDGVLLEQTGEVLRATAPTAAFTAAVVLALSAAAPATAAAAGFTLAQAATTGKGAAKLAAIGIGSASGAALAGIIGGVFGGVFGVLGGTRRLARLARDAEERNGIQRFERVNLAVILLFAGTFLTGDYRVVTVAFIACMTAFVVMHFVWLPRIVRRRIAAELEEDPSAWRVHRKQRRFAVLGCAIGLVVGGAPLVWAWWRAQGH
ncbi:MAG: RNA polymerase sigma factor [bacterium]